MVSNDTTTSAVASSSDGITWVNAGLANTFNNDVIFNPAVPLFFVVNESTSFWTSPDGLIWTSRLHGNTRTWRSVAYSPSLGLYAMVAGGAVGTATQRAMTTANPVTGPWNIRTTPLLGGVAPNWNQIVWSAELGMFVASAIGDSTVGCFMTSTDGITWTLREFSPTTSCQGLDYSPSLTALVSSASGGSPPGRFAKRSVDGINWKYVRTARPPLALSCIFWDSINNKFIAGNNANGFSVSRSGK